jgi:hypothetical protein
MMQQRAAWIAAEPTVFYYSSASQQQAQKIATELTSATGRKFKAVHGGGYALKRGQEQWALYIHIV